MDVPRLECPRIWGKVIEMVRFKDRLFILSAAACIAAGVVSCVDDDGAEKGAAAGGDSGADTEIETDTASAPCGPDDSLFPELSGPYCAGVSDLHLVDDTRGEPFTEDTDDSRELMVRLFYPVARGYAGEYAPYMDESSAAAFEADIPLPSVQGITSLVRPRILLDAPPAPRDAPFPVLVFSPGFGTTRYEYTALLEEMASHGYVVVAINHPGISGVTVFPDDHEIPMPEVSDTDVPQFIEDQHDMLVEDARFVLDAMALLAAGDPDGVWTGRLDLSKVGAFGHSLGGSVAVGLCREDARCLAADDIDGSLWGNAASAEPFAKPLFLFLSESHALASDPSVSAVWDEASADAFAALVGGAAHIDFADYLLMLTAAPDVDPSLLGLGSLDAEVMHDINRDMNIAFFDAYVESGSAEEIDAVASEHEEVDLTPKAAR